MPTGRSVPTPAQRFFMASSHRAVAGTLLHGLRNGGAVAALTGEPGLGKSMLLRHVLDELGDAAGSVLTVPGRAGTVPSTWQTLQNSARPQASGLLVIEDAHEMSPAQLGEVADLLDRSPWALRPRLVFVAQPSFWQALSAPGLAGLRDAIATRAVLFPMVYADAERYVAHLFRRADATPQTVLGESALHALLLRAEGNPQRINAELRRTLAGVPVLPGEWRIRKPRTATRGRVVAGVLTAVTLAVAVLAVLDMSELPGVGPTVHTEPESAAAPPATAPALPPSALPPPAPAPSPGPSKPTQLAAVEAAPPPDINPPPYLPPPDPVPRDPAPVDPPPQAAPSPELPTADSTSHGSTSPDLPVRDLPVRDRPAPAPALASRVEVRPAIATQPPLPDGTVAILIRRGNEMLALDDIAAARLFYERAARSGSAAAALLLGDTFDPALVDSDRADPAAAATWYRLAKTLGSADAPGRLARMAAAVPQ